MNAHNALFSLAIFFGIVSVACSENSSHDNVFKISGKNRTSDSCTIDSLVNKQHESVVVKEDVVMAPPVGFSIDSLIYFDTLKDTEVYIWLPVSGIGKLDAHIKNESQVRLNEFLKTISAPESYSKSAETMYNMFWMRIATIYSTDSIVSYQFHVSTGAAYAVHSLNCFYSYTYDKNTGKEITFNDFFDIKSRADSVFMIRQIVDAIRNEEADFREIKNMDFNIVEDSVSFNFDNYELGGYNLGTIEAKVSKFALRPVTRRGIVE